MGLSPRCGIGQPPKNNKDHVGLNHVVDLAVLGIGGFGTRGLGLDKQRYIDSDLL